MGEEATERAATADETAAMRAIVREAVAAGALGFATSKAPTHVGDAGKPVPSRLAELDEVRAIAGALGELGRGVIQATAGPGLFFHEFATLARETGRPLTWTALLAGMMGPGSHRMFVEQSEAMVSDGHGGRAAGLLPAAQLRVRPGASRSSSRACPSSTRSPAPTAPARCAPTPTRHSASR